MPKPNIVEDESDYDLNNDRKVLATIRKERAETLAWQFEESEVKDVSDDVPIPHPNLRAQYNIAITNYNHFGFSDGSQDKSKKPPTEADLQSLA